jgi:hypothetical protein
VIRPEALSFPPLNCSLDERLGDYYQDLSPALSLVEDGYHGGLDPDGIPVVDYGEQGRVHNPITVAQYALANLIAAGRGDSDRRERARAQLDWLVEAQADDGELRGCWPLRHDNPKYPWLRAPWVSALAQGNGISALLRGWQALENDRYREAAAAAYDALHAGRTPMALTLEHGSELWYEEYPAQPPLHVLNGHVYALLGVADHARALRDEEADGRWRRAAGTAVAHLEQFDLGYWSAYDLRFREPVSLHYQRNIHVPLLRVLAALTGDTRFAATAQRWDDYAASRLARLRWGIALRLRRHRRHG